MKNKLAHYECDGQMSIFDFISKPKPKPKHIPPVHRYLRYGPHTLIPEVREETKAYLEENGVPDWVTWDKLSVPCKNCTWYDGKVCCSGGHTNHFEFGYLICDGFYQSIVERKPSTVGDAFPPLKAKVSVCEHSGHTCNKQNLWEVADTLDETNCPHVCCRQCNTRLCGARCNGSEEPKQPVNIKGICDDAYCPECDYQLDELKELDCEQCPECGTRLDWTPWHRVNDE